MGEKLTDKELEAIRILSKCEYCRGGDGAIGQIDLPATDTDPVRSIMAHKDRSDCGRVFWKLWAEVIEAREKAAKCSQCKVKEDQLNKFRHECGELKERICKLTHNCKGSCIDCEFYDKITGEHHRVDAGPTNSTPSSP